MKLFLQSLLQIILLQKQAAWPTNSSPSRVDSAKWTFSSSQDRQIPLASKSSAYRGSLEPILKEKIGEFVHSVLKDWDSPGGVGIAVVRKDDNGEWLVETGGYGNANAEGDKVDEDTLFAIASNSKLFTAIATGLLIHNTSLQSTRSFGVDAQGKPKGLEWTTPLKEVIPGFDLWDRKAAEEVTILDALSHRTGVPRHDGAPEAGFEVPDTIKKVKYLRPSRPLRDLWQYNNLMYEICSYLPTAVLPSEISYARYVKENIFEPLGLSSTTYSYEVAKSSGKLADGFARDQGLKDKDRGLDFTARALPYWNQGSTEDGNGAAGDGGVVTSAKDVATWLQTLLLLGKNPITNESVIPPEVVEKVAQGVMVARPRAEWPEFSPTVYGMGQERGSYRGHEWIEHTGGVPGFKTVIIRFPGENLGISVLSNDEERGGYIIRAIEYYLADVALGLDPVNWHQRYKDLQKKKDREAEMARLPSSSVRSPRVNKIAKNARDIWDLEGIYHNPGYGSKYLCVIHPSPSPDVPPGAPGPCKAVRENVREVLPGIKEAAEKEDVPTLVAEWFSPFMGWVVFRNFGDSSRVYNISGATSYPTGDPSRPYWIAEDNEVVEKGATAEVSYSAGAEGVSGVRGLGFNGIWGGGLGVKSPEDGPEVWFEKV